MIRHGAVLAAVFVTLSAVHAADDAEAPKTKAKKPTAAVLAKYDTNKDGKLDDEETKAMNADIENKKAVAEAKRIKKYDTNKDGKLDEAELAAEATEKAEKKAAAAEKRAEKKAEKAKAADQAGEKAPSAK